MAVNTVCTSFRLQSPRVCSGIVDSFKVSLVYFFLSLLLSNNLHCSLNVTVSLDCTRIAQNASEGVQA